VYFFKKEHNEPKKNLLMAQEKSLDVSWDFSLPCVVSYRRRHVDRESSCGLSVDERVIVMPPLCMYRVPRAFVVDNLNIKVVFKKRSNELKKRLTNLKGPGDVNVVSSVRRSF
jgi:hypothetical protein